MALKTFIKQLIMLPIFPNIHRLGFLALRKILTKQNKKEKKKTTEGIQKKVD